MSNVRKLRKDEVEVRTLRCSEKGASLFIYKTARVCEDLLDELYGVVGWQCDFKSIGNGLACTISVKSDSGWISKSDFGEAMSDDNVKGAASDAFKRAASKFGIGRELYSLPNIWISSDKCNIVDYNGKKFCYDNFEVTKLEWTEDGFLSDLEIKNVRSNDIVWRLGQTNPAPMYERSSFSGSTQGNRTYDNSPIDTFEKLKQRLESSKSSKQLYYVYKNHVANLTDKEKQEIDSVFNRRSKDFGYTPKEQSNFTPAPINSSVDDQVPF